MKKNELIETGKKYIEENGIILAELTGSEKQIEWASDLRYTAIGTVAKMNPKADFFNLVNEKTDAKFWIDNDTEWTSPRCIIWTLKK